MPAERKFGMDHPHHNWSPLIKRNVLEWPNNARVALCVVVTLEHLEWEIPEGAFESSSIAGGVSPRPRPDFAKYSHRDYGHRVGIYRVLDVLKKYGVRPTIALDALTAEHYPYLVRYCREQGCEFIGHGVSVSRMINSRMSVEEEKHYIESSIEAVTSATGIRPKGWFGPEYGESADTPQLLAQAGLSYACDWVNDEQPFPMTTAQGDLFALPLLYELDDIKAMWDSRLSPWQYETMLKEGFDCLYHDGATTGRLMAFNLHPWVVGQPYRISYLDRALSYITAKQGVWAASGSDIIDWYRDHQQGA
ncbi:polysaccharide deacetylase [SAR202 cluster bacterium AD-804-J14_MRT_500m]|nr:polysaccharide deacetylase [SAR202 cluster bacterium AD-804-J14_MRT_500m]